MHADNLDGNPRLIGAAVDLGACEALPAVASITRADANSTNAAGVYTITVVYSDVLPVDVSSPGDANLRVTGPGGFDQPVTFVGVTPAGDGTPRTATYYVTPPGGTWDDADCGNYTVALVADQVRDTLGNTAAAGTLRTFNVGGSCQVFLPLAIR